MKENITFVPSTPEQEHINSLHEQALELNALTFEQKLAVETDPDMRRDLEQSLVLAKAVAEQGGVALVVGGYARDEALRRLGRDAHPKDIDIEVYGLPFEQIMGIIENIEPGAVNIVGSSFGVLKYHNLDISIPRRDSKTGSGHKGFTIEGDATMTVAEAANRRDFTINTLALNPLTGEIIDEFDGLADLKTGVLRATNPELFGDDPLRVLRAMQFAGRFEMDIDPETVELCRGLDLTELSRERLGEEWNKLLLKAAKPSIGLEVARELGIIEQLHPELAALFGVPQEAEWHPEGDVWVHTKMVADAAADIIRRQNLHDREALIVMYGALCHDLGKPATTEFNEGKQRITSHAHDTAGVEPTKSFLRGLKLPQEIEDHVIPLVKEHLYPSLNKDASDAAVRRLANRLKPATIGELVMVAEADHRGRTLPWHGFADGNVLLDKAERLGVEKEPIKPIVKGRDLIELGIEPGPSMGGILKQLYSAQEDGHFATTTEGLEYYRQHIANTIVY